MRHKNAGLVAVGVFALAGLMSGCSGGGSGGNDETSTAPSDGATKTAAAPSTPASTSGAATIANAKAVGAPLICPVTGNKIASMDKAVGHSTYKGKTYNFCCSDCKPKFDKNAAKYVANAAKGKFESM